MTGPEFTEFLHRHRKLLIALLILVVLAALAFFGYDKMQRHRMAQAANYYLELNSAMAAGQTAAARASAETLTHQYAATPYSAMARLFLVRMDIDSHQTDAARKELTQLLEQSSTPTGLPGMARVALAQLDLQAGKPAAVLKLLKTTDPAYRTLDEELQGDAEVALKHYPQAVAHYEAARKALPITDPYATFLQLKLANIGVGS